jgi:hypothetical protein
VNRCRFFLSIDCLFILVTVSSDVQNLFNLTKAYLSIIILIFWAVEILFQKAIAQLHKCFPILISKFQVLNLNLQAVLNWCFTEWELGSSFSGYSVFQMLFIEESIVSLSFYIFIKNHICSSVVYFSVFYSICLCDCFCASTMLLVGLCRVIWSQVLWYLQHCSFCPGLLWLVRVFYASIWILELICLFLYL